MDREAAQHDSQRHPRCRWFANCTTAATKQVEHPRLGWVDICDAHLAWLGKRPSPTQFVPPLAAAVLDRHPEYAAIIAGTIP